MLWEFQQDYGHHLTKEESRTILESDVTCVIAGNDIIAIDLMQMLRGAGVDVPTDVSIIGFDDIGWSELVTPPLTTIRLPKRDIGEKSLDLLCDLLEQSEYSARNVVLDVSLVERQSVGAI